MFAKLPPSELARRETIAKTNMGRREALFYATLASTLVFAAIWAVMFVRISAADSSRDDPSPAMRATAP